MGMAMRQSQHVRGYVVFQLDGFRPKQAKSYPPPFGAEMHEAIDIFGHFILRWGPQALTGAVTGPSSFWKNGGCLFLELMVGLASHGLDGIMM